MLVVEDEAMVRGMVVRILTRAGYTVLQAGDGEEALRMAASPAGRGVELVVADVVMPHLGGPELVARLRAERPDLAVLFMSGYTERGVDLQDRLDARTAFVSKPFTAAELARRVKELLDARALLQA